LYPLGYLANICHVAIRKIRRRRNKREDTHAEAFLLRTPQQENVQLAAFGSRLTAVSDALVGYRQSVAAIQDPEVVRTSGKTHHPIVAYTGKNEDRVPRAIRGLGRRACACRRIRGRGSCARQGAALLAPGSVGPRRHAASLRERKPSEIFDGMQPQGCCAFRA
jgi:hypothetical protein